MNRTVFETYIMHLGLNWKIRELVVSKHTGGLFAQRVIASSMNKDFVSAQRHFYNIYEHGWYTEKELEVIRLDEEPALKAGGV
jgi:hypothetical protein